MRVPESIHLPKQHDDQRPPTEERNTTLAVDNAAMILQPVGEADRNFLRLI